ncbi:glycosyltransferase [Alcanivorax sediminis]|uniref:Glycosyltransferase n=1 Tax=Alcanivorax sediminis TaxID=2663008 RepID=A0A6N7LRD2_9GAMM|nr:glycosyltransferase [Alcanivorax sediminis]MQX52702.1 glycosyltransferase [Alcanivorax sediminis]
MKKVLLVTGSMKIGGLNSVIVEHARMFLSAGYDVRIILTSRKGELPEDLQDKIHYLDLENAESGLVVRLLYAVFRTFLKGIGNLFAAQKNRALFENLMLELGVNNEDMIVIHGFKVTAALRELRHPNLVKVMHEIQSKHAGKSVGWVRRIRYRLIAACYEQGKRVAVSRAVKDDYVKEVGGHGAVTVIGNGVNVSALVEASMTAPSMNISRPYIVSVGRLVEVKGFDVLIRAFAKSNARHTHDLVIVGEGKERGALCCLSKELGVDDRVHLAGYVKPPFGIVREATLYVGASFHEGFGLALLEAMCLGLPVVASRVSGFEEIMEAYPECMFEAGNVEELARLIDQTLLSDGKGRPAMPERYDFDEILKNYLLL